ncbi:MAG: M13 family metallopeptidase [Byssovorax sp.]
MRHLFLAPVLTLSLAACGGEGAVSPPPVPPSTPSPEGSAAMTPAAPAGATMPLADAGINAVWMDPKANACQDFYQLACGALLDKGEIPADRTSWGPVAELQVKNEQFLRATLEKAQKEPGDDPAMKKIGAWYGACMNEGAIEKAGVTPLQPLLDVINKVKDAKSLYVAVTALHKRAIFPFFDVGSLQDFKDATLVIAALDQSGLGLPNRDYYLDDDARSKDIRTFYQGHVERLFGLVGARPDYAKKAAEDVLRIETALARIAQDKVERRDPYKVYNRVDRPGLARAASSFPWNDYWKGLGFAETKDVSINSVPYFTRLDELLKKEKADALRSYLTRVVIHSQASRLSSAFVKERFALKQKLSGQKELEPRWRRCVASTDNAVGELLAQKYVAERFDADSKREAKALIEGIRGAMRTQIGGLPWMDAPTRAAAVDKLTRMNDKVGYPERWKTYDFEVGADFMANALVSDTFELGRVLKKVGKPVDRNEWQMTPPTINAYYDPSLNEMVFPAGILQPPFFDKRFAAAVNHGATGAVMGHELTHGFDDEGSKFDGSGNLRNWWSDATGKLFKEQTKCVVDQYSAYEAVPGVHLNGELTAGENIADIGGIALAYSAYRNVRKDAKDRFSAGGYTEDQLFFLSFGQTWCQKVRPEVLEMMARTNPHSPARFRVNGVLVNTPQFAEAFSCKPGTPMRPAKTCSVW